MTSHTDFDALCNAFGLLLRLTALRLAPMFGGSDLRGLSRRLLVYGCAFAASLASHASRFGASGRSAP
eukprot:226034-Pleurochrysis_carterae.AAC.1